jgi:hypothetical protein
MEKSLGQQLPLMELQKQYALLRRYVVYNNPL